MFEFEVDHQVFSASELPEPVQAQFAELCGTLKAFSLLPWEEHCTECAMPHCYQTCDLYQPRKDGKCRRFHYGFGHVRGVPSVLGYVSKVSFKRWGQLMAYANARLVPFDRAKKITATVAAVDRVVANLPDSKLSIKGRAGLSSRLMRRVKQQLAHCAWLSDTDRLPENFVIETYNPKSAQVNLSLVIRDADGEFRNRPFQQLLRLEPGFNRIRIPFADIRPHIDLNRQFHITLCPNLLHPTDEGLTLYFGLVSFILEELHAVENGVTSANYQPGVLSTGIKYVKVLAWDLDNTLWEGILIEDGEDCVRLRPGVVEILRELDRRGILNSLVSRNDAELGMSLLRRFGIDEYFLFPKINWDPKSRSVADLVTDFNVGVDTIAVIDDSPFERSEIAHAMPGVRVYSDDQYKCLLRLPEFRPPLSDESAHRREFYRAEENRNKQKAAYHGDYLAFLRDSRICVQVRRTTAENIARAHELIQRTNQLNFSGNRYSRESVERLVANPTLMCLNISCNDRFGDYGLVGFCLLDKKDVATVTDLMFSCRVQAKRVEHAFLIGLIQFLSRRGATELRARYKRTSKNVQAAKVFEDLGFRLIALDDTQSLHTFSYELRDELPQQDIVTLSWDVQDDLA